MKVRNGVKTGMYKLVFKLSSWVPDKNFGTYATKELAYKEIMNFLEKMRFKSDYWRIAPKEDGAELIDFGGHGAFFEISEVE